MPIDFKNLKEMRKRIESVSKEELRNLEIDSVVTREQVRKQFKKIEELANSIKEIGLQQPIIVEPANKEGKFIIVQGERRYRACKQLGLKHIPAIIRKAPEDEKQRVLAQLTENLQRDDMDPFEVSAAMHLLKDNGVASVDIAKRLGKSKTYVSRMMSLSLVSDDLKNIAKAKGVDSADVLIAMGESERKYGQEFLTKLEKLEQVTRADVREIAQAIETKQNKETGKKTGEKKSSHEPTTKESKEKVQKGEKLPVGATYVEKGQVVVSVSIVLNGQSPVGGYIHPHAICKDKNNVCVVVNGKVHVVSVEDVVMLGTTVI